MIVQSPTYGKMSFDEMIERMIQYIDDNADDYKIIIGTDSNPRKNGEVEIVTAIVVQRVGKGGIYFWQKLKFTKIFGLRTRIYQEAMTSLDVARRIIEQGEIPLIFDDVEIHVDIGTNGETRKMIKEIVGMVTGNGFPVKTKPDAYVATKVADRHT